MGVGFLEGLVSEPKVYNLGDPTVFVSVARYSSTPGWCFLP